MRRAALEALDTSGVNMQAASATVSGACAASDGFDRRDPLRIADALSEEERMIRDRARRFSEPFGCRRVKARRASADCCRRHEMSA
jgi:hypothetical protein